MEKLCKNCVYWTHKNDFVRSKDEIKTTTPLYDIYEKYIHNKEYGLCEGFVLHFTDFLPSKINLEGWIIMVRPNEVDLADDNTWVDMITEADFYCKNFKPKEG